MSSAVLGREDLNMSYIVPAPGSVAKMGDIEVKILAVMIRGESMTQCEVSWIVNGDRKTAWIEEHEIRDLSELREVGFRGDLGFRGDV